MGVNTSPVCYRNCGNRKYDFARTPFRVTFDQEWAVSKISHQSHVILCRTVIYVFTKYLQITKQLNILYATLFLHTLFKPFHLEFVNRDGSLVNKEIILGADHKFENFFNGALGGEFF